MIIVISVIMKASSRRQILSIFSFCGEFLRHHLYVVCLWWQQWWAELAGGRMIPACNLAPPTWDLEWRVAALWPWSGWVSGRCGRQCALPHSALTHSETRSWGIGGWLGDIPWEDCVVSNKCAVFTESHNITCTSITSSHFTTIISMLDSGLSRGVPGLSGYDPQLSHMMGKFWGLLSPPPSSDGSSTSHENQDQDQKLLPPTQSGRSSRFIRILNSELAKYFSPDWPKVFERWQSNVLFCLLKTIFCGCDYNLTKLWNISRGCEKHVNVSEKISMFS